MEVPLETPLFFLREDDPVYVASWGLCCTFSEIPLRSLFAVVAAILLERKVAIYSASPRLLSAVVLSLSTLLLPFHYHGVVCLHSLQTVTCLPQKLRSFLDAPVPFLVGLTTLPGPADQWAKDAVIFDLDKHILTGGQCTLPDAKLMVSEPNG